jgi:hypothetical protein
MEENGESNIKQQLQISPLNIQIVMTTERKILQTYDRNTPKYTDRDDIMTTKRKILRTCDRKCTSLEEKHTHYYKGEWR